jgi:hypothetical protein
MTIELSTVARIEEVGADPATAANIGAVYTKDVVGVTQLFYREDASGTVYQLTPPGGAGSTPWQRTGTLVALDQTGDTEVNPFDDNSTSFGTSSLRWLNVRTGVNGLSCFTASGDANRSGQFGSAGLSWGPGGATALDAGLSRSGVAQISVTSGDGAGSGGLFPLVDGSATALLGNSTFRWRTITGNTFSVFVASGDTQPSSRLTSATLSMGPGGAVALDVALVRSAVNEFAVSDGGVGSGSVIPNADANGTIGTAGNRWSTINVDGGGGFRTFTASGDANASTTLSDSGLALGPGGAGALDILISRNSVPLRLDVNVGTRFGGDIERFQADWLVRTVRTADGIGPNITMQAANGVAAAANTSNQGGIAQIVSGNSAATLVAQAAGRDASVTAGNGASGVGGGAANGGDIRLRTGQPGANGGSSGVIVVTDQGDATGATVVPPTDNTGNIGTAALRFALVRATTITSGDVCFDDQVCQVCRQPFAEGDDLVLRVIRIEPDGDTGRRLTRTVPAHHGCR